jgi:hypothetical protein
MMQKCYEFQSGVSEERENALTEALIGYNRAHSPLWEHNPKETA